MQYDRVLINGIEREKKGVDYVCSVEDKKLLYILFDEINKNLGTNIQYLAEIDLQNIVGAGEIIAKYITSFSSESIKGYLLPQMVADKIKDCDKLILQLYTNFKLSDEYIGKKNCLSPAHICVRYDNAFKALKPKRLISELMKLAHNPRDVFNLPLTIHMIASWKIPEMCELLLSYANADNLNSLDFFVCKGSSIQDYQSLEYVKREIKFTAIRGLKFYPTTEIKALLETFTTCEDADIRLAAKKTLKAIQQQSGVGSMIDD